MNPGHGKEVGHDTDEMDPWREIEDMFDRYTKAVGWPRGSQEAMASSDWSPRVDIVEAEQEFLIKADIPGVEKDHVKVSVENGVLTIQGERKTEKEEKDAKFHRAGIRLNRHPGHMLTVPENVTQTAIKVFDDGMLTFRTAQDPKGAAQGHRHTR